MTTPEINKGEAPSEQSQNVVPEQEAPKEAPPVVEEKGATVSPGQLAAQVSDNTQQATSAQVQDDNTITITVPATPQQLEDWSKGSPDNALTWFAFFWIRMIKKALFHGWRVVTTAMNQPAIS
jgi:hypothetical protein